MGNLKCYIARGVEFVLHGIPVKKVIANISYTNPSDKLKGKGIDNPDSWSKEDYYSAFLELTERADYR